MKNVTVAGQGQNDLMVLLKSCFSFVHSKPSVEKNKDAAGTDAGRKHLQYHQRHESWFT